MGWRRRECEDGRRSLVKPAAANARRAPAHGLDTRNDLHRVQRHRRCDEEGHAPLPTGQGCARLTRYYGSMGSPPLIFGLCPRRAFYLGWPQGARPFVSGGLRYLNREGVMCCTFTATYTLPMSHAMHVPLKGLARAYVGACARPVATYTCENALLADKL